MIYIDASVRRSGCELKILLDEWFVVCFHTQLYLLDASLYTGD